ncbi:MAG: hypothetical protein F6K47_34495, partial [Symploca sp. SIO2E6]|nr:hypothetical protein [Symploca sp. SIO2E6]
MLIGAVLEEVGYVGRCKEYHKILTVGWAFSIIFTRSDIFHHNAHQNLCAGNCCGGQKYLDISIPWWKPGIFAHPTKEDAIAFSGRLGRVLFETQHNVHQRARLVI